ncbi:MAG: Prodigiosin synthesizing transferase PigC [Calditrichaeota bacterium]|nr:Prodigiosin synthesizing transferase PigC [Calditrichota bacterium]
MEPTAALTQEGAVPDSEWDKRTAAEEETLESLQDRSWQVPNTRFTDFQRLMRRRVNNILLVSSLYDSFILAQDGQLEELMLSEFMQLNLYHAPSLTRVPTAAEALELARTDSSINVIVATSNIGDISVAEFAQRVAEEGLDIPVILLTYDNREIDRLLRSGEDELFDRVFLWQGDFRVLLAIVKYAEDRMNADHDTRVMGVQTILLVEDNIRFYSVYLPMIYGELMQQSQSLLGEGLNLANRILRMRARPKILLCTSYEEAWDYYLHYESNMLGVITDIEYKRGGEKDPRAGVRLVESIHERREDIPILLQSFREEAGESARELGIDFVRKDSPTLLHDLRRVMKQSFSFGDFIFRIPDGEEIGRADDLKSLETNIRSVPAESLLYHATRDHFSSWLKARTEFAIAAKFKSIRAFDYDDPDELRRDLIVSLSDFRMEKFRGLIADFQPHNFDPRTSFARLSGGSMGGKARGLAFLSHLIDRLGLHDKFEGVRVSVPASVVIGTDVFDQFLQENNLTDFALNCEDDVELADRFTSARFPHEARMKLDDLLRMMDYPIAVRSSGLLEDSLFQPFAGIYSTYFLPNNHPVPDVRVEALVRAIKMVYASTYARRARSYFRSTPYRLEEEKMAVIVQRLVGVRHEDRFYPDFAGVARSHNFYPSPPAGPSDGIANVALGLGTYIMEGGEGVRFCPKYPKHISQFATIDDFLNYSQKKFYCLKLPGKAQMDVHDQLSLAECELATALADGTLNVIGSIYSHENRAVYDGVSRDGMPLVSFAPILKHRLFPLASLLRTFLNISERGVSRPVELEFAVNYSVENGEREFVLLQLRPLVLSQEQESLDLDGVDERAVLCRSDKVLGAGRIDDIRDIVYVDPADFDRSRTREVSADVARINSTLQKQERPYLLIGLGRWGSTDPWLGIPVNWEQISGVRVIVESSFDDIRVQPSEGAHFFHNITSLSVGYFTVNEGDNGAGSRIDWQWLRSRAKRTDSMVRHVRLNKPLRVLMDGHRQRGVILKPGANPKRRSVSVPAVSS